MEARKEACKYGAGCYQKNQAHRDRFSHPPPADDAENKENNKRPNRSESEPEDSPKKMKYGSSTEEEEESGKEDKGTRATEGEKEAEAKKETEYNDILPPSPANIRESVKQKFLVEMPEDFYQFYDFCKGLNKADPHSALEVAGLRLCGPFDVLGGKLGSERVRSAALYLRHCRYYYDPPEFQTVINTTDTSDKSDLFHIGYFRDSPDEPPVFVASNCAAEGPRITPLAENIFGAVYHVLAKKAADCDPFMRSKVAGLQEKVKQFANRTVISDSQDISLDAKTAGMRQRDRQKMAVTFHGAGMVVPYDKKTQVGYREIPETAASLKKIFRNVVEAETEEDKDKALDVLQELVTNVQFANDEGDPGMGLELGIDAFCYGGEALHGTVRRLLSVAYELLDRDAFATILQAHLDHRVKGPDVDSFRQFAK